MFSHWMSTAAAAAAAAASAAAANHSTTSTNGPLSSTSSSSSAAAADVLLDVGPPPYVRYAGHSHLLAAHSGYLRSALRTPPHSSSSATPAVLYLANLTAEQFAPLLTYMYTGYLDLTADNIFGVLLATHVLHMPRAAEICRAFLTRSSGGGSSGYLPETQHVFGHQSEQRRIVRPIASKATGCTRLPAAAFGPTSARQLQSSKDTPFRSTTSAIPTTTPHTVANIIDGGGDEQEHEAKRARLRSRSPAVVSATVDESVAKTAAVRSPTPLTAPPPPAPPLVALGAVTEPPMRFIDTLVGQQQQHQHSKSVPVRASSRTGSNSSGGGGSCKTIIDIASCDGPVRFRRVLNEAYGLVQQQQQNGSAAEAVERNAQHVATSFHLQMARTISGEMRARQQQQQQQRTSQAALLLKATDSDDSGSENSQLEINVSSEATNPEPPAPSPQTVAAAASGRRGQGAADEQLYVCVYCKHTFKSQYCFQKHAKRHINPLTMDDSEVIVKAAQLLDEAAEPPAMQAKEEQQQLVNRTAVRREVRPLDMNVQYYPCKTCGSKFPSYYFVHKHRKLCHANEEN